jgi:hypothetical protein
VEWRVAYPIGIETTGLIDCMFIRIPAAHGQIATAGKRHTIIDDNDLLMLRRSDRKAVVETECQAIIIRSRELRCGKPFAFTCVQNGRIPDQQVNPQPGTPQQKCFQKGAKLFGISIICAI